MGKIIIILIVTILVSISFSNCDPDKKSLSDNNGFDWKTMLTPYGGKLGSAEEGPDRSALGVPTVDLTTYQLEVSGLVDSIFSLTWGEIQALPAVYSDTMFMYCVEGWEVFGNWKGVLIKDLLDKAHVKPDGTYVLFGCVDGYTTALSISYLIKYNAMLAYQVNGSSLKEQNGFPLRLIAFGKYGYKWAKWVNKLEVMDESQIGYWESFGYSDRADVPIERRRYYEGQSTKPLEY